MWHLEHRFDLAANNGSAAMATQIIMDLNGDTRHNFDAKDVKAHLEAERHFKALTGAGFTAATRTGSGESVVTRPFDPTVEETLFFPRLSVRVRDTASRCERSAPATPSGLLTLGASLSRMVSVPL